MALLERWQPVDLRTDPDEAEYVGDPGDLVDAAGFLLALITRPAWMADALCREHPELSWYPDRGKDVRPVKAVCERCLVRPECLAYADGFGIWAGTSVRQRRQLRRTIDADAA